MNVAKQLHDLRLDQMVDIFDRLPVVVYAKNRAGEYLFINRRYEELTHRTRAEVIGRTDYFVFPSELADIYRAHDERVWAQQNTIEFEEEAILEDGRHSFLEVKFPLRDTDGTMYAVCAIATDITERKRSASTVAALQRKAALKATISQLSHELNNPLTAIVNSLALMRHEGVGGEFLSISEEAMHRVIEVTRKMSKLDIER
ncbi:MAG TPA: PAS domain-containing protein [Terriglobales bacterium]|nr:PAS domain-containing protein [Terriglobales bacterium]